MKVKHWKFVFLLHSLLVVLPAHASSNQDISSNYASSADNNTRRWSVGLVYRGATGITLEHHSKRRTSWILEYSPSNINSGWASYASGGGFYGPNQPTATLAINYKFSDLYGFNGLFAKMGAVKTYSIYPDDGLAFSVTFGKDWQFNRYTIGLDYELEAGVGLSVSYRL